MLARTFLRICALEALTPAALIAAAAGGAVPSWPTLANEYVWDSRLDPIEDLQNDERRPVVVIYTEEDNLDKYAQAGPVLYKSVVDLVFEISVAAKLADDSGAYQAGLAYADNELEADLDLLEAQIYFALHFGPTGVLFRQIAKLPLEDWQSLPHRTSEEGYRLAARTIRAKVHLKEVCYIAAPTTALTGLDRLPPVLRGIADQLAANSTVAKIVAGLSAKAPVMPPATPLAGILTATVAPHEPPIAQASTGADTPIVTATVPNLQG